MPPYMKVYLMKPGLDCTFRYDADIEIWLQHDLKDILLDLGLMIYFHMKEKPNEELSITIRQMSGVDLPWDRLYQYLLRYGIPMTIFDRNQKQEEEKQQKRKKQKLLELEEEEILAKQDLDAKSNNATS